MRSAGSAFALTGNSDNVRIRKTCYLSTILLTDPAHWPSWGRLIDSNRPDALSDTSGTIGVGNHWGAWAYSIVGLNAGLDADLNSATPESGVPFQLVRNADTTTIALSVAFNPAGNDTITVWLNPDFATEAGMQTADRTTTHSGNFSFNTISLRVGGTPAAGWDFSNIQVATTPQEIGFVPEPSAALLGGLGLFALMRRRR
jgi:hypothetical protein